MQLLFSLGALSLLAGVRAQSHETHNLTPDGYWHNEYHGILAMAAYDLDNVNTTCPAGKFNGDGLRRNFPNSRLPAWTMLGNFSTPSGCVGFTARIPEMNKALIVFRGDYAIEQNLSADVVSWDAIGLGQQCPGCLVNRQAAQAYMECKAQTNNWAQVVGIWRGTGQVFSITGHGFGGMLSQIASVDLNVQNVDFYSHAYGSPAVFNAAGAAFYDARFNGEAGERGIYGNDQYVNRHNGNPNYAHAGTAFHYSSTWNETGGGPSWEICWKEDGQGDSPRCQPHPNPSGSTAAQDHYYYFADVTRCNNGRQNTTVADQFIARQRNANVSLPSSASSSARPSSTSSAASLSTPIAGPTALREVASTSAYDGGVFVTHVAAVQPKSAAVSIAAPVSLLSIVAVFGYFAMF